MTALTPMGPNARIVVDNHAVVLHKDNDFDAPKELLFNPGGKWSDEILWLIKSAAEFHRIPVNYEGDF